jgi:hypothetical protein
MPSKGMRIPKEAKDFTADWLNSALANSGKLGSDQVTTCAAVDSDIPGQTAEIILIDVTYKDINSNLPTKMVAKVTSRNPVVLEQVIANYDQYRRETSFYREFPDIGIAIPECLYEKHNPETQECVILMGDLAPAESPSWAITTNQVKDALNHLPAFHAKWWNHPKLKRQDWMVQNDNHAFYAAAMGAAHGAATAIDSLYEDAGTTIQIMEVMNNKVGTLIDYISTQPLTFVHGDYHAKQMFFPTETGGEFAVIDWQFPFVAQGAWDFARMLGMCMSTEDRRKNEAELLLEYHRQLMSLGIKNYDMNHLQNDYRMGLIISQMIMVIAAADTDIELLEKECSALGVDWRDAMFNRTQHALEDWNVLDFAQSL